MSLPAPEHTHAQHGQHGQQLESGKLKREVEYMLDSVGGNEVHHKTLLDSFFAFFVAGFCIQRFGTVGRDGDVLDSTVVSVYTYGEDFPKKRGS